MTDNQTTEGMSDLPHLMMSLSYTPDDDRVPQVLRDGAAEIERLRAALKAEGDFWNRHGPGADINA